MYVEKIFFKTIFQSMLKLIKTVVCKNRLPLFFIVEFTDVANIAGLHYSFL